MLKLEGDVEVLDPPTYEESVETKKPEPKKDDPKDDNRTGAAPPKKGPCMRCGGNLALNRLFLCYRCWVITNLEDRAKSKGDHWQDGDPHPDDCGCVGLGEHKNSGGSFTGSN